MEHLLNEILQLTFQNVHDAERIQGNTETMTKHIQSQDIISLNSAIDERQKIMDRVKFVNEIVKGKEEELQRLFSNHRIEDIDRKEYPQIENIISNKTRLKAIYSQTYELEKSNRENAEGLLKGYRDEIKELHRNKKALQAYGSNPTGQSILINKVK